MSSWWNMERGGGAHAVKGFSVGSQAFSVSAASGQVSLSSLCTSGACSELLCAQLEAPLHPNPSTAGELHQECVSVIKHNASDQSQAEWQKISVNFCLLQKVSELFKHDRLPFSLRVCALWLTEKKGTRTCLWRAASSPTLLWFCF